MARLLIIGDTHCRSWAEVHPEVRRLAQQADLLVHCGDYTGLGVVRTLQEKFPEAVLVHGNSDPPEVRRLLPWQRVLELNGKRIAVTHPWWGGPPFDPERILSDFEMPVDAVLFGHTHDPMNEVRDGVLFLNPGQSYRSFLTDATVAFLTVEEGDLSGEIRVIEEWRLRAGNGS